MKVFSKPISSPGRTESFPPPLMRFVRSNVGSRSRGRSRSSPMFLRKKNTVIETQEPSSPKVTCIGQVRAHKSSGTRKNAPKNRHCWCARTAVFWRKVVDKLKFRPSRSVWCKWVLCFKLDFCKCFESRDAKMESDSSDSRTDIEEEEDEESRAEIADEGLISSFPPKNALILTRCRSAPYKSSSLACRFWGSPLMATETGDCSDEHNARSTSESESEYRNSRAESTTDRQFGESVGISEECESSIDERIKKLKSIESSVVRVVTLTRCKSEPARTGERLNPEANLGTQRRFDLDEPCSPHACD